MFKKIRKWAAEHQDDIMLGVIVASSAVSTAIVIRLANDNIKLGADRDRWQAAFVGLVGENIHGNRLAFDVETQDFYLVADAPPPQE